jgi:hypothetical protein
VGSFVGTIDNPRYRLAIDFRDHDVCRFQITVNDGFLVRVLDPLANLDEQLKAVMAHTD